MVVRGTVAALPEEVDTRLMIVRHQRGVHGGIVIRTASPDHRQRMGDLRGVAHRFLRDDIDRTGDSGRAEQGRASSAHHNEYKLPDKIVVSVIERTPLYIAYNKDVNKYYLIDGEGYILEESKPEKTSEEQVFVYGIVFSEDFDVGDKINDIDKSKLDMFLNIKNELKNAIASASVTKVSFENALTIITLNDKLNVVFSDDKNLKYVIAFLSEIINNVGIDSIGTIDMTKKNPTFSAY